MGTPAVEGSELAGLGNMPLKAAIEFLEIHMLKKALTEARYHQKKAARILGLSYDQFRGLKRKYNDIIE
jgi:psp operon transcriptional activator